VFLFLAFDFLALDLAFDFLTLDLAFDFLEFDFLPPTIEGGLGCSDSGKTGAVALALVTVATFPAGLVCVGALTFIPCNGKVLVLLTIDFVGNTGLFTGFPTSHSGNIDDKKPILF
jgi:hypothetical protein